jgi:2-polyprenyl-3-methyl-5-hydroxy-6-metoxy-1,4-benzoquinol methylase
VQETTLSLNQFSWRAFYQQRQTVRRRYRTVFHLPIRKRPTEIIFANLRTGIRVLDVGASTRSLGEKMKERVPSLTYKTMDIDRTQQHDYYSLSEIRETFDLITLIEVIEHLPFENGLNMLRELTGLLNPGGKIIVTTPNLHHPSRYWCDCDHRTPYEYQNLGAVLLEAGFDLDGLYRTYNDQFLRRFIRRYLTSHLHRYLDLDFADTIVAVGVKP